MNEKTDREKSYSGRGEEGVADGPRAEKGREAGIFSTKRLSQGRHRANAPWGEERSLQSQDAWRRKAQPWGSKLSRGPNATAGTLALTPGVSLQGCN